MKNISIIVLITILMSGCASIVSKNIYPVSFNSNPPGAKIVITNGNGLEVYSGETPVVVELSSKDSFFSGATYKIVLSKKGYDEKTIVIQSKLDGWYFGNILFGGLIGMIIVDPATGAMWALPTFSETTLTKDTASTGTERELRFAYINDISKNDIEKLIKLN